MAKEPAIVWENCEYCGTRCTTGKNKRGQQVVAGSEIPYSKLCLPTYRNGKGVRLCGNCFDKR